MTSAPRAWTRTFVAVALVWTTGVHGQESRRTLAGRAVTVWAPPATAAGQRPVLVFSHGYGGCATQSRFLMTALAGRGYLVFAPDHGDARCGKRGGSATRPEQSFTAPERWSERTYDDRADDIRAVLEAIAGTPEFASRADLSRIGLVGHSLGGYTVLGLAGGWPSWRLAGVRAVLALSPYVQPFVSHGTLGHLGVPVMYQGGTLDVGITPWVEREGGGYDSSPAPKYFVDFARAGHLAWTDLRDESHRPITDYALAFLDRYVSGDSSGTLLTRAEDGVAALRYESDLGTGRAPVASGRRAVRRRGGRQR
jgi:dienelactone hydrolase